MMSICFESYIFFYTIQLLSTNKDAWYLSICISSKLFIIHCVYVFTRDSLASGMSNLVQFGYISMRLH